MLQDPTVNNKHPPFNITMVQLTKHNNLIRVNRNEYIQPINNRILYWTNTERHRWMLTLFLGCTALYSIRALMPVASVAIQNEYGWNKKDMGVILGAFFYGYMATQFLGGYLSDLIGGEYVLTIAAFGWSFAVLLFPLWDAFLGGGLNQNRIIGINPSNMALGNNKAIAVAAGVNNAQAHNIIGPSIPPSSNTLYYAFILSRILLGLCQGFHYPSVGSLMAHRVAPKERQFTYSVQSSGAHLGTLLCGSVGSLMIDTIGWKIPFICVGAIGFVWTLVTRALVLSRKQRIIQYNFKVEQIENAIVRDPIPWKKLLKHPAFWAMLIGHYCHTNSFVILLSWMPTYFHDNFPDAKSWVFNVVPWLVTIPSVLISGLLGDYMVARGVSITFIRKFMTTVVLLGTAFFLFIVSYFDGYYYSLAMLASAITCTGFHSSGIMLNSADLAPKFGGAVFGITNMVGAIPGFLGVYMAGYTLEVTKSWTAVFNQTAGICVFGWVVYSIFGTAKKIV